jgi:hypothetical protein
MKNIFIFIIIFMLILLIINQAIIIKKNKNYKQYLQIMPSFSILLPLCIFSIYTIIYNNNIAFCETFEELDAFILEGHHLRIEILEQVSKENQDLDTLKEILVNLKNIYEDLSLNNITDPFSEDHVQRSYSLEHSPRSRISALLLFILLSLFGFLWFNALFLFSPLVYYQLEIQDLLLLFKDNPELFLEPLANYYMALSDTGFFDVDDE